MRLPHLELPADNLSSPVDSAGWCSNETGGVLHSRYCSFDNLTDGYVCDSYWQEHSADIRYIPGIPGMASNIIKGEFVWPRQAAHTFCMSCSR